MSTKSRADRLATEVRSLKTEHSFTYRRPKDGAKLVVATSTLLDAFFDVLGGAPSRLSDRARRFLGEVPVHSGMSDVEGLPVLDATGRLRADAEEAE